jgi:hypothetical protein
MCRLSPGAADSHTRARSRPCVIVVHRHGGACRQRDAARGDRQLGVPVEDHERVRPPARPPARPPLSSLLPPSHAFKRPAWHFASHARCSQGLRRLPRPGRQRAADDLRADRAHEPVRPLRAAGLPKPAGLLCRYGCSLTNEYAFQATGRAFADAAHALLRERVGSSFGAAACLAVRAQALVQERFHRPDPGEHHGAHQAGLPVHPAAARAVGLLADSDVRMWALWRRGLGENRFSGSVPPTISALTALTSLYIPTRCRAPADAAHALLRERVGGSFHAAACFTLRGQGLGQERLHRPDPGKHHGAHQAGLGVRPAAARAVFRPTRVSECGHCGAGASAPTASPAASRRRSPR